MKRVFIDFESRSAVDIKVVGAWKYAAHPSTDVIAMAVSGNGKDVDIWRKQDLDRARFGPHDELQFVAHNAHFEYAIYNLILHRRYGWPAMWEPKHWDCTLARAVTCGLPAALDRAALALNLPIQKDMEGRAAMLKLCKPLAIDPLGDPIWNEDPELFARMYAYCKTDVLTEIELDKCLPPLSADERKVWELDLVINRRGVQTDVPLAQRAADLASKYTTYLNDKLTQLTGGAVDKASRVSAIKYWLRSQGISVENLDKEALVRWLTSDATPPLIRDVLRIRQQVGKSSTAKYQKTVEVAGDDGRVRGALQYHAAHTGRWGGRLIQPQNYPKGLEAEAQKQVIEAIEKGTLVAQYGERAMDMLSGALRGTITAGPGKQLVVADFAAIEARVLFWLADDVIALAKFRCGENLYVDMAKYIYHRKDISKHGTPKEYAVGKAAILGCGYGMGGKRFVDQSASNGVSISEEAAVAAVRAYREKYNTVVNMWYATERAAIAAVKVPGSVQSAMGGKVAFAMGTKFKDFLVCRLPSGRFLFYYRPSVKLVDGPHGEKEELHYWAVDEQKQFSECKTYGGALVENITQAVARDLMANGMLKVEAAGYNVVLTVHDELVAEIETEFIADCNGKDSEVLERFIDLMCDVPSWAMGCPVTAEGWIGSRYRK